jgi:ribosome-binding ATPase YchF (GTP1/OBG family)
VLHYAHPIRIRFDRLSPEDAKTYFIDFDIKDSSVSDLIRAIYRSLRLASYSTVGEIEVHAWRFKDWMKAPQCVGIIHGDFERGSIKAEVVSYGDLMAAGTLVAAKEAGKYWLESKEYEIKDGDIIIFVLIHSPQKITFNE